MSKSEARQFFKKIRLAQKKTLIEKASRSCAEIFTRCFGALHWDHLFLYAAIQNEIQTAEIFDWAKRNGLGCSFPLLDQGQLLFAEVEDLNDLVQGQWTLEPPRKNFRTATPQSLILVPGLAFDRRGLRLGYGRGYYDRFLENHPQSQRIGLCSSTCFSIENLPAEAHDQKMDFTVTSDGLWRSPERRHF